MFLFVFLIGVTFYYFRKDMGLFIVLKHIFSQIFDVIPQFLGFSHGNILCLYTRMA